MVTSGASRFMTHKSTELGESLVYKKGCLRCTLVVVAVDWVLGKQLSILV